MNIYWLLLAAWASHMAGCGGLQFHGRQHRRFHVQCTASSRMWLQKTEVTEPMQGV